MNEKVEQTLRDLISAVNNLRDAVAKLTSAPGNDETRAPTRTETMSARPGGAPDTHGHEVGGGFATADDVDKMLVQHGGVFKRFIAELLDERLMAVKTRTRSGSTLDDDGAKTGE